MSETIQDKHKVSDFLTSEGKLGEMIRNFDWGSTALGPIDSWPQSLKTTVNLMLHSKNPIWIGWGSEITFLYNDAYIDVLGIDKHGWALGKPAIRVWEEIWDYCGPLAENVFRHGKTSNGNDVQLFMKRGSFLEETFFSFSYSPVYDEYGKVGGLFCPNFETTGKILSARRNRTLSELATKSLTQKSINSAYASAAAILRKNPEDVPFAVFYNIDKPGERAELVQRIRIKGNASGFFPDSFAINDNKASRELAGTIVSGKPTVINIVNPAAFPKGQASQPVTSLIALPLITTAKKTGGLLVCGINPTRKLDHDYSTFFELTAGQVSAALQHATSLENERKRLEELAEIDKAKTAFFSNISHEFRTPLTLMLGPLEDLMLNHNLGTDERQSVETTHRNALRLLKLVNTLLDFSLIESGRLKAVFTPIDLCTFTKSLAGNFRSITEKAGLELVLDTCVLSQKVYADREMWEKIVFNLLSNAFKYTLKGSITVSLTEDKKNAILRVTDTGSGIPAKELPNMFSRFHRIRGAEGRSFEGSGIGLSMIKELITQHGGNIGVVSTEGQGSIFTVTIPFGKEHLPESQIFEEAEETEDIFAPGFIKEARRLLGEIDNENIEVTHETVKSSQPTILVVDDNADMRTHLKHIIEKEFSVITANNGAEALEIIHRTKPALILSDVMMPVMDGIELLKEVKSNPIISMIPVILLTARAGEESRIEGYETGADDYLVKPFSAKELTARIRSQIKVSAVRDHSRKQLKNLFMQAPVAICILSGRNFVVEMANEGILDMWGKPSELMIGKPLFEGLPEAAEQGFDKLLEHVYDTGIPHVDEETLYHKHKGSIIEEIYVKFVYQPLFEGDGAISGIMVLATEITPQVIARKKIEESENKFRNLIRHAPMAIVILKGEDLVFDVANNVYLKIHNKTQEQLLGKNFVDALPQFRDTELEASVREVYQTGISKTYYDRPVEFEKDGKKVTRYFTSIYQPLMENGKITGVISVVNEVTEQYLAQKLKDKNEKDLKLILETMPHIAFRANPDGLVTYYNDRYFEYTGLKPEEAFGNGWKPAIHPAMLEEVAESWMKSMENGSEYTASFLVKRASDQSYRWHMSRAVALRNEKGEITEWIGTLTDVHETKVSSERLETMVSERTAELNASNRMLAEKNLELEKTNKELESFNYVASHDLQEPLRKIQTFISMIQDRGKDSEIADNYLNKIYLSAGRMSQLIQDVLAYSRLDAEDQFTPTDLNEIFRNVLADYELMIIEQNATVSFEPLPTVNAIGLQMHQLFSNLVSNALKYSNGKPEINVKSTTVMAVDTMGRPIQMAEIVLSDNGIGFEQKYSEQIFKLFRRLHGRTEYKGTGIGLSICKKIVEQHHGTITAASAPGKGTSFTILLPL